jgi:undecaprenyl-diphosphatase
MAEDTPTPQPRTMLRRLASALIAHTVLWFAVAAAATVLFVEIAEEIVEGHADTIDTKIALAVHRFDSPLLDTIMRAITHAGSWPACVASSLAVAAWAVHRARWRAAVVLALAGTVTEGLNAVLKLMFARDRPTLFDEIVRPESYSFPSGHAMTSLAVYGAIAAVVIQLAPGTRWIAIPSATVLVLAIGFSRVYLGVHWPLDVVAGFAAAVPLLATTVHLLGPSQGRRRRAS